MVPNRAKHHIYLVETPDAVSNLLKSIQKNLKEEGRFILSQY